MDAKRHDAAAKEHRRKYHIENTKVALRLEAALKVLDEHEEPILRALDEQGGMAHLTLESMRAALRLLAKGAS